MRLPLEGVTVIDLSRLLPGPFCSWTLGDFGADVIRVEEPLWDIRGAGLKGRREEQSRGAVTRPTPNSELVVKTRAYDCLGRNKRSIILDLKQEAARGVIYRLARRADVFLEEFRPGVAKRLGVDYDTISQINPQIIYCSISLYGQDGPYHELPGHDPCALSVAGAFGAGGDERGRPVLFGVPVGDVCSGLHAVIGILLALRAREKTGKGQYVDISMTDSALDLLCTLSQRYFGQGFIAKRGWKSLHTELWETKDGKYLCTTNVEPYHWANFCRVIGREDFIPYQHDLKRREEIHTFLRDMFATKTREEWLQVLRESETQVAPLYEVDDVFADPQLLHRGMLLELDHPLLGRVKQQGISIKLSETPGVVRSLAATPGENTRQILLELGYTEREIEELERTEATKLDV